MNQDWWERPVCIICDYWWVFLFSLLLIISFLVTQNIWRPWLGLSSDVPEEVTVVELQPVTHPEVEAGPGIRNRLLSIAGAYSSPASRPYSDTYFTSLSVESSNTIGEVRTQDVQGTLLSVERITDLKPDWPSAYVLWIQKGSSQILTLFRGGVDHLMIGEAVTAGGVYDPIGDGLHLDWIEQKPLSVIPQPADDRGNVWFIVIATLAGIWGVFVVGVLLTRKKGRIHYTTLALFLALVLLTTGCTLNVHTVVDLDGRGFVLTTICEDVDTFDFIRQTPGMNEFMLDRIINFRQLGVFYEDLIIGDQECITFQNPFSGLGNIANGSGTGEETSWAYVHMRENGLMVTTRYSGLIDTTTLYEFYPTINPMIQTEMRKALDEVPLTFSVSLPGDVVYHNADYFDNQIAFWQIPMNATREVVVESVTFRQMLDETFTSVENMQTLPSWENLRWIIVGAVFLFSTIVFVIIKAGAKNAVK